MSTIFFLVMVNSAIAFGMCWLLEWLLFGSSPRKAASLALWLSFLVASLSTAFLLLVP